MGATRTTLFAPMAGTRVETTTCGGVRSTTMVMPFEVAVVPFVES